MPTTLVSRLALLSAKITELLENANSSKDNSEHLDSQKAR